MKKIVMLLCLFFCLISSLSLRVVAKTTEATTTEDSTEKTIGNVVINQSQDAPSMAHTQYDDNPTEAVRGPLNTILVKYKSIILGASGVVDIFLIGVVIWRLIVLGSCPAGNANERRTAIMGLGISLFAVALMGSFTLWYGLFFNALK